MTDMMKGTFMKDLGDLVNTAEAENKGECSEI
jgi:hypothetical protein